MFLCTAHSSKAIHFALFYSHIEHSARDYSNINQILWECKILTTLEISCMEYDTIQKKNNHEIFEISICNFTL